MATTKTSNFYEDYGHDALTSMFDRICDQGDWKAPIDVLLKGEDVQLAIAAIEYFTATQAKVSALIGDSIKYRVQSIGYRQGPAGDH